MTFKEFEQEEGTKKEWYVCEYTYYKHAKELYNQTAKYLVTRYPNLPIYKGKVYEIPKTLQEARKFRTILNKLKGN